MPLKACTVVIHDLNETAHRLDVTAATLYEAVAQALFHDNPLAAFEGRTLPYEPEQPDPLAKPIQYKRRKRFLFF